MPNQTPDFTAIDFQKGAPDGCEVEVRLSTKSVHVTITEMSRVHCSVWSHQSGNNSGVWHSARMTWPGRGSLPLFKSLGVIAALTHAAHCAELINAERRRCGLLKEK